MSGKYDYRIVRQTISFPANQYTLIATLPKETVIWRVRNLDATTTVRVSVDKENPVVADGDGSVFELEPKMADAPPIVPALLCRAVNLYAARTGTATSPTVEVIYTTSRDPRTMMAVVVGSANLGTPSSSTSVSGNIVQISGQAVQISGQTVSISGGISVSGSTVYTANPNRGLIFSGFVSWGSGNTSGNPSASLFGPPSVFGQDDIVVVGLQHAALSSDVTLVIEKAVLMGGTVVHLELTRFSQNRGTSGVAQPVRGIFAGGTSGRILALHSNTLVENVTGNIVVYHL